MKISRRHFLASAAVAHAAAQNPPAEPKPRATPPICLYSQAVIKIDYADLGSILGGMGFDGCNLTVQKGGHISPGAASMDLVRAVESIRGAGIDVPVISTSLTSLEDPDAQEVLGVARILKIPLFRPGHWKYLAGDPMTRLAEVRRDIAGLTALARAAGMSMAIHNQAGDSVGSAIWDTDAMIRGLDQHAGYDFDIANATTEGGAGGWLLALRLALPRLKMVTVADFQWSKQADGRWKPVPCPLGEGMVDWPQFLGALASAGFRGPVSLRVDYEPGAMVAAIRSDLEFLKKQIASAYA